MDLLWGGGAVAASRQVVVGACGTCNLMIVNISFVLPACLLGTVLAADTVVLLMVCIVELVPLCSVAVTRMVR
jgi:hypothetical protein